MSSRDTKVPSNSSKRTHEEMEKEQSLEQNLPISEDKDKPKKMNFLLNCNKVMKNFIRYLKLEDK